MPLRLGRHHDKENPPLIVANFDTYRGATGDRDDNIFVPGHVEEMAGLLPMLHDLETVEVWQLEANGPRLVGPPQQGRGLALHTPG